jgi:hypothetical protein
MRRNPTIAMVILFFPIFVWGQAPELKSDPTFTLIFSSNSYGEIEPCGRGGSDLGGLARRATYLKELQPQGRTILILDTGDLLASSEQIVVEGKEMVELKSNLYIKTYNSLPRNFLSASPFLINPG